jgi:hypothetical protein
MNSDRRLVQPPSVAVWLLTLFGPAKEGDSIAGDLLEEFTSLVRQSGVALARSWYWRQSLKTVGHLFMAEFRAAPWLLFLTVVGGFWLIGFGTRFSGHAVQRFLDTQRIYELHPDAYLFWYKFPLEIGRVILCTAIGSLVALAARRKEMAAVMALACVQMVLFGTAAVAEMFSSREWLHWFLFMLTWNSLCAIATVAGGAMVKTRRTVRLWRPAA